MSPGASPTDVCETTHRKQQVAVRYVTYVEKAFLCLTGLSDQAVGHAIQPDPACEDLFNNLDCAGCSPNGPAGGMFRLLCLGKWRPPGQNP